MSEIDRAAWTPGPWTIWNHGTEEEPMISVVAARIAGQPPRHEVAICCTGDSPQWMEEANASLISAAPDLFAALQITKGLLRDYIVAAGPMEAEDEEVLGIADAALAKAQGEL